MITAIVIAQIDPEAVNEKIETALEDDEEFQKKIDERKREIERLRQEIESFKNDPLKKIDPKRKEQLELVDQQKNKEDKQRNWKNGLLRKEKIKIGKIKWLNF